MTADAQRNRDDDKIDNRCAGTITHVMTANAPSTHRVGSIPPVTSSATAATSRTSDASIPFVTR